MPAPWTGVCFDLDGTLTDPKLGITGCIAFAMERLGPTDPLVAILGA